ncbi:hypothetical protein CsSME_00011539 [Camellia sinensis var. sinensis]
MASSATPCTLMLSHGASSLLPQPLTPSLSFKPKPCFFNFSNTFSLYPLVAEEIEQLQEGVVESGVVVTPTKPKKGKAALPLKSDRRRSKRFLEIQKLRKTRKSMI